MIRLFKVISPWSDSYLIFYIYIVITGTAQPNWCNSLQCTQPQHQQQNRDRTLHSLDQILALKLVKYITYTCHKIEMFSEDNVAPGVFPVGGKVWVVVVETFPMIALCLSLSLPSCRRHCWTSTETSSQRRRRNARTSGWVGGGAHANVGRGKHLPRRFREWNSQDCAPYLSDSLTFQFKSKVAT